jgi:predicted DNA-binding antitoxin AbrB/MazE fold protein
MHETIDAVYENGVFRPLEPLPPIEEHRRVRLTVNTDAASVTLAKKPSTRLQDYMGGWPKDEIGDGFEDWTNDQRHQNPIRDIEE